MEARILTFDGLSEMVGKTVFEEWICGTGAFPCKVLETIDRDHIRLERDVFGKPERYIAKRKNREYRFWDAEPLDEQREFTPWKV